MPVEDLIAIYFALIRSVLEYASPVVAALSDYLDGVIEGVQNRALRILLSDPSYRKALIASGLGTLSSRRRDAWNKFV